MTRESCLGQEIHEFYLKDEQLNRQKLIGNIFQMGELHLGSIWGKQEYGIFKELQDTLYVSNIGCKEDEELQSMRL